MNRLIISNSRHPLYSSLQKLDGFLDYSDLSPQSAQVIFDLTALPNQEKTNLFHKLEGPIISDLSLNNGVQLMKEHKSLAGAVSTVFPSPKNNCEVFLKEETYRNELDNLLSELGLMAVNVSSPGIGFIFPRTIVQIINEAWFALEDELASPEAIDTAMLFGVNYPKGPLAWGEEAGLSNVVSLLNELYKTTNEKRYRVCKKLEEAQS